MDISHFYNWVKSQFKTHGHHRWERCSFLSKKDGQQVPSRDLCLGDQGGAEAKAIASSEASGPQGVPRHWPERQRPPRAQEGLACPPRPCHPKWPVRQKPSAQGGVERDGDTAWVFTCQQTIPLFHCNLFIKKDFFPTKNKTKKMCLMYTKANCYSHK